MLKKLFLVSCLFILGCEPAPKDVVEYERTNIKLNVMLFDTERGLNEYIHQNYQVTKVEREGFSVWYKNDPTNECTILVLRGTEPSKERVYGHELMHCIYGTFHKEI